MALVDASLIHQLVKAATGEVISAENLGGGELHAKTSGVVDHLATSDSHALAMARRVVASLNRRRPQHSEMLIKEPVEPLYDPAEIGGIVGDNVRKGFDVRQVIARIVDGSRWNEFKEWYGPTLRCGGFRF